MRGSRLDRFLLYNLLRTVTWPHWRANATRTLLTTVGVSIGVATIVGIANVSASVLASFHQMVDTLAGSAAMEVTNPGSGVDEHLLETVRAVRGVQDAGGLVEGFVPLATDPGEQIFLLGVDFLGSPVWETQFPRKAVTIDDTVLFLSQLDSVALSQSFLDRRGLGIGDELSLLTPLGPRALRVRGIVDSQGPARLFGGSLGLMDLGAAQRLFSKEGRLDRIAVLVDPAVSREDVQQGIARALGDRAQVMLPEVRGQQADLLLFSLRTSLMTMSLTAVIVGAFIIYLTVAVSVDQRRRTLAIMNAVGVRRGNLVQLCVTEIVILAVVGAGAGILAGQLLARVASGMVGDVASEIWLRVNVTQHSHSTGGMVAAVAVGVLTAAGAAYLAARATFSAPTVESLRAGPSTIVGSGSRLRAVGAAAILLAAVWLVVLAPPNLGFVQTVSIVIGTHAFGYAAAALLVPSVVRAAGWFTRRLTRRWTGFSVRLAVENLPRSETRSAATISGVAAAFSIAMVVAVLARSFEGSWMQWLNDHFGADVYVGRGDTVRLISGPPMSMQFAAELAAIDGVEAAEPFRTIPFRFRGRPVFLESVSVAQRLQFGGLPMVEGDLASAAASLVAGTGVLLSDNFAFRYGLHRGDTIELSTLTGMRRFRVEGTFVDYLGSLDLGSIAVEAPFLREYWGDDLANLFRVWLVPGASPTAVRADILRRLGRAEGLYVLTAGDFLDAVKGVIQRFFAAVWALEIMAALIGVIGIINAQVASVFDRARELTVLRAIGIPAYAIRRMVILECAQIGFLGGLVGGALGLMLGTQLVLVALHVVTGWRMSLYLPTSALLGGLVVVTLISAAAGYVPARVARRLTVVPVVPD